MKHFLTLIFIVIFTIFPTGSTLITGLNQSAIVVLSTFVVHLARLFNVAPGCSCNGNLLPEQSTLFGNCQ
jgi:hypothetical protein